MPMCFQLTRKGDKEPSTLQHVDKCICQALDIPYDDKWWAAGWYDSVGLLLACGKSFEEIMDIVTGDRRRIAAYLNEHYTTDSWKEWK